MRRNRSLLAVTLALLLCGSALASGNGGACVHISNPFFGPDTIAVGQWNRFEIWIENDANLTGMYWSIRIDHFDNLVVWKDELTQYPYATGEDIPGPDGWVDIIDYDRALGEFIDGSCWTQTGLQRSFISFDGVGMDDLLLAGAVGSFGEGLLAGESELCFSLDFYVPEASVASDTGMQVTPVLFPPAVDPTFVDEGGGYFPDFCGVPPLIPYANDTISFPYAVPRPRPCGDANYDSMVNIADVIFLIRYIWGNGPRPEPYLAADFDCDNYVYVLDLTRMIKYIFLGEPGPCEDCVDYGAPPE